LHLPRIWLQSPGHLVAADPGCNGEIVQYQGLGREGVVLTFRRSPDTRPIHLAQRCAIRNE